MPSNAKFVVFDLDGTLSNPHLGISRCIVYALEKMGISKIPTSIDHLIGPSLQYAFAEILETDCKETIAKAVSIYRERYATDGLFENELYPNIPELLESLKTNSKQIFLATAKPEPYAKRILEHFKIDQYFDESSGATLDGQRIDKVDIIEELIKRTGIDPTQAVMIGDRHYDILGGKSHGMKTIGVTYGFGSAEELKEAQPDLIANSANELSKHLSST